MFVHFLDRRMLPAKELLKQRFLVANNKSSLWKCYSSNHGLLKCYGMSVSQMTTDISRLSYSSHSWHMTAISVTGISLPSCAPDFTPNFLCYFFAQALVFCIPFDWPLVFVIIFLWQLYFLSFDLQIDSDYTIGIYKPLLLIRCCRYLSHVLGAWYAPVKR